MKTILIPTNFSETAWTASVYVADLYSRIPCHYIFLNTYHAPSDDSSIVDSGFVKELEQSSEEGLEEFSKRFEELQHHADTTTSCFSFYGLMSMIIDKLVDEKSVDLVAMGTSGASGISGAILGSNTSTVVTKTNSNVLCVPDGKVFKSPKNILFASDYEKLKEEGELAAMIEIAKLHQSKISILNIRKDPVTVDEAIEGLYLHYKLDQVDHEYFNMEMADVEEGILDFAHTRDTNLITLIRHHHGLIDRIFKKSISKQLTMHTDLPLLILKE